MPDNYDDFLAEVTGAPPSDPDAFTAKEWMVKFGRSKHGTATIIRKALEKGLMAKSMKYVSNGAGFMAVPAYKIVGGTAKKKGKGKK